MKSGRRLQQPRPRSLQGLAVGGPKIFRLGEHFLGCCGYALTGRSLQNRIKYACYFLPQVLVMHCYLQEKVCTLVKIK